MSTPPVEWTRQSAAYGEAREALLASILERLQPDDRFLAAWLGGSHGRGLADLVSDLDLTLVVTDAQRDGLCARPWLVGEGTTARRLAVLRLFGEPAIIHENHHNAPAGGTFTFTLYAGSAQMVDWVFVPLSNAQRPAGTRLLFEKQPVPPQPAPPAEGLPQRIAAASERVSFFWMMAAITARRRARGDDVGYLALLDTLYQVAAEIERLTAGEPFGLRPRPRPPLAIGPAAQAGALRAICARVLALMPEVERLGGNLPPSPMPEMEVLLGLR